MKKTKLAFSALVLMATLSLTSCKPKDSEIQAEVSKAIGGTPGITADVKDGVVTLAGEVGDDATKTAAETAAKAVKGVKSVTDNITIKAPEPVAPATPVIAADDALTKGVAAAVKDFPGVTATVNGGVVALSGEITKDRWMKLKQIIDALKPKKTDASGLKIK